MTDELVQLAIAIADDAAAMDIGAYCEMVTIAKTVWFDVSRPRGWSSDRDTVERAMRYLDLQQRLVRHPTRTDLVRIGTP